MSFPVRLALVGLIVHGDLSLQSSACLARGASSYGRGYVRESVLVMPAYQLAAETGTGNCETGTEKVKCSLTDKVTEEIKFFSWLETGPKVGVRVHFSRAHSDPGFCLTLSTACRLNGSGWLGATG